MEMHLYVADFWWFRWIGVLTCVFAGKLRMFIVISLEAEGGAG